MNGNSVNYFLGGIVGASAYKISDCYVTQSSIETNGGNNCSIGGILGTISGNHYSISKSYLSQSSIKVTGATNNSRIGGIFGNNDSDDSDTTECYVKESIIEANDCKNCYIGGFAGTSYYGDVSKNYVLNTKVQSKGTGQSNFIGGFGGDCKKISSCYFYYDKDDETPLSKTNNDYAFGLILGRYNSDNTKDCFSNKTDNLIGVSYSSPTNFYNSIDSMNKFALQTWSDGAWNAYNVGADKPWPLDLINNPRQ